MRIWEKGVRGMLVRYYGVGVAEVAGEWKVFGLPGLVSAPGVERMPAERSGRVLGRAEREAVEQFFAAYLAGVGEVSR